MGLSLPLNVMGLPQKESVQHLPGLEGGYHQERIQMLDYGNQWPTPSEPVLAPVILYMVKMGPLWSLLSGMAPGSKKYRYIYIYIYVCVYVCICICALDDSPYIHGDKPTRRPTFSSHVFPANSPAPRSPPGPPRCTARASPRQAIRRKTRSEAWRPAPGPQGVDPSDEDTPILGSTSQEWVPLRNIYIYILGH